VAETQLTIGRVPYVFITPSVRSQRFNYHAFQVLRAAYTVLFLLAGADKFRHLLTNWEQELAAPIAARLPVSIHDFMLMVGVTEIFAGILIAAVPRIGAFFAAGWLLAVAGNVLFLQDHGDIALRNVGLALGALALGLLARSQRGPLLPRGL